MFGTVFQETLSVSWKRLMIILCVQSCFSLLIYVYIDLLHARYVVIPLRTLSSSKVNEK